jgi:uncharacterized protein YecE (DUF72 family)
VKYQGSYNHAALKRWAMRCQEWHREKKDVYLYFDNDMGGCSAFNAIELKQLMVKETVRANAE